MSINLFSSPPWRGLPARANAALARTLLAAVLMGSGSLALAANYYMVVPNTAKKAPVPEVVEPVVSLAAAVLPRSASNQAYSISFQDLLQVTGDASYTRDQVTWSVGGAAPLPSGLTLSENGTLSGKPTDLPTEDGVAFEVTASYKGVTSSQAYVLRIQGDPLPETAPPTWVPDNIIQPPNSYGNDPSTGISIHLRSADFPPAIKGQPYSVSIPELLTVTGDAAGFDPSKIDWYVQVDGSSGCSCGIYWDYATQKIHGTLSNDKLLYEGMSVSVYISATYKGVHVDNAYTIRRYSSTSTAPTYTPPTAPPVLTLSAAQLPAAMQGASYATSLWNYLTLSKAYTASQVVWSLKGGSALPSGLTLGANGVISGVPAQASATPKSFTVRVAYQTSAIEQTFTLPVNSAPTRPVNHYFGDGVSGAYLGSDGFCNFDWYRPANLAQNKSVLTGGEPLKLQARFLWSGSGALPLSSGEHAVLAFTQSTNPGSAPCPQKGIANDPLLNSPRHPVQQAIHKYGVGAILTNEGMKIEFWNGDGTALVWGASNGRCAMHVPTGANMGMCLSASKNDTSYITNASGQAIEKGAYYWLRLTVTPNSTQTGWAYLHAELLKETSSGPALVQEGAVGFMINQYMPGATLEAGLGHAPPGDANFYRPSNVLFWAYDGGF